MRSRKCRVIEGFEVNDSHGHRVYNYAVLGNQHGIGFCDRGEDDPHQVCEILSEDDGNWFRPKCNRFSSFWLMPLAEVIKEANDVAADVFVEDMSADGIVWGWLRVSDSELAKAKRGQSKAKKAKRRSKK